MDNKSIIINFSKRLWEQRDLAVIDEFFVKEPIIHSPLNIVSGDLTMKEIANKWLEAFPDLTMHWIDFTAEEDRVISRWYAVGTHLGSLFGTRPSHFELTYSGVTTFILENSKIKEYWALVDVHSILKQVGVECLSEAMD